MFFILFSFVFCLFDCTAGVTLYGGERASGLLKLPRATSYHTEYSALSCTVEIVKDVQAAIDHIHEHGRYEIFWSSGAVGIIDIIFVGFTIWRRSQSAVS